MIPLVDLRAQYNSIKDELDAAVLAVLSSGEYIQGSQVAAFEREFSAFCGGGETVCVNSGTSALHLALLAAGIGHGDEVITVPMTFVATVSAIYYSGARAVFVDVRPDTWNMDPEQIEKAITPRTKAIMPVHLHGRVCDMEPILAVARKHNLLVIEDAAQAHGAKYRGKSAGTFGDMACFSFYAGKNLGAAGEGGAVVSSNPEYLDKIRLLRDWGARKKYVHELKGYNYRMENIQGAVLRVKLRRLEEWTARRGAVAALYDARCDAMNVPRPVTAPTGDRHAYHIYAVRVADRDVLHPKLVQAGVGAGIHYPIPVHMQPAFKDLGYAAGDFPVTEAFARETISLPLFPEMTGEQVETVCGALKQCLANSAVAAR